MEFPDSAAVIVFMLIVLTINVSASVPGTTAENTGESFESSTKQSYVAASKAQSSIQLSQSQLDRLAAILQSFQNVADSLPIISNMTSQIFNALAEFRGPTLFLPKPCTFIQGIFRSLYCTIAGFDPQRTNSIVQGLLQFLNANNVFYSLTSNFFCPFEALGGSGSGNSGSTGTIACANNVDAGNGGRTTPGNEFSANLDDPQGF